MSSAAAPSVDDSPFDLIPSEIPQQFSQDLSEAGRPNRAAALCLHGLTGTPYEVRPLAEALVARGIRARGIRMAGHDGGVEDLARSSCGDWVDRAREELLTLRAEHDRVHLVGVSMGGLVSLRLAQTERVDALVVVGVPLVLAPPIPQLLPLLRLVMSARKKRGSDIRDPEARARHPGHAAMPLDSVRQLIALEAEVIPNLGRVEAPILVAHGELDTTARPRDARRLHAEVGSSQKELMMLPRSGHVATVDYDGLELASATARFLSQY